ncbi:hypothetical protein IEQ34_002026 [Dendrobium chrysotoxum]|uniref:Uncharacterized protein n=1 Tax=Dendrobium chrysotoxum TaxID=161865 RepID=A0AAV7H4T2_DENCH|nr:hypothetical protein IEQ34_002026 [Dendrobium chrysotoxum]
MRRDETGCQAGFDTLNKDFAEEIKSGMPFDDWKSELAPEANSTGHVALDVANLSLLATGAAGELDLTAGARNSVKKTLSRKGSQRGGELKSPNSAVAVTAGAEKLAALVHVADDGEDGTLRLAMTTTARAAAVDGRLRRLASRRPAPWLDPRRVLVFFATLYPHCPTLSLSLVVLPVIFAAGVLHMLCLAGAFTRGVTPWSSVGTLILLYFTLFMGNIPGGDGDAW